MSTAASFAERRRLVIGGGFQPVRADANLEVRSSSTGVEIGWQA